MSDLDNAPYQNYGDVARVKDGQLQIRHFDATTETYGWDAVTEADEAICMLVGLIGEMDERMTALEARVKFLLDVASL